MKGWLVPDRHDEDEEVGGSSLLLAGRKGKNFGKYPDSIRDGDLTAFSRSPRRRYTLSSYALVVALAVRVTRDTRWCTAAPRGVSTSYLVVLLPKSNLEATFGPNDTCLMRCLSFF